MQLTQKFPKLTQLNPLTPSFLWTYPKWAVLGWINIFHWQLYLHSSRKPQTLKITICQIAISILSVFLFYNFTYDSYFCNSIINYTTNLKSVELLKIILFYTPYIFSVLKTWLCLSLVTWNFKNKNNKTNQIHTSTTNDFIIMKF